MFYYNLIITAKLKFPLEIFDDNGVAEGEATGIVLVIMARANDEKEAFNYAREEIYNAKTSDGEKVEVEYVEDLELSMFSELKADFQEKADKINGNGIFYKSDLVFFIHDEKKENIFKRIISFFNLGRREHV